MKIHTLRLHDEPYKAIASGQKTIEYRLHDEKRKSILVGDLIEFVRRDDESSKIVTTVVALHHAAAFSQIVTDKRTLQLLAQFYTDEDQNKYGVLGIEIRLLSDMKEGV